MPSSMATGISQSMRMPSRSSVLNVSLIAPVLPAHPNPSSLRKQGPRANATLANLCAQICRNAPASPPVVCSWAPAPELSPKDAGTTGLFGKVFNASLDRVVDPRQHLFRHELHRALGQGPVRPVVAGIEQSAEIADRLAEGQELVDDAVDRAANHQRVDDVIKGDGAVGQISVVLEELGPAVADELLHEVAEIEA